MTSDAKTTPKPSILLAGGYFFDDLAIGDRFHSVGRTITETDLVTYVNLTWFTEELFTDHRPNPEKAMTGKVVPGGMLYTMAEGLIKMLVDQSGLAFLHTEIDMKGPTRVGDTIHVEVEVTELRPTRAGDRGLVRTRNTILNQDDVPVLVYTPLRLVKMKPQS